jgi:hypothetical protein
MNANSHCRLRLLIPLAVLAFLAVLTFVVRATWNGVLVDVVAVRSITYWQALGLLLLARILFGGWPGRGRCIGGHFRERMMTKHWESLDPEQRDKMREEMRHRFGDWPRPSWCDTKTKGQDGGAKPTGDHS